MLILDLRGNTVGNGIKFSIDPSRIHFLDAIRGEVKNESHFQQTGPMTETILLGTVAIRVPDTELKWDAEAMKFTNSDAANAFLRRDYRDGWELAL